MDKKHIKRIKAGVSGILIGLLNGLFGSGGGLVAVPMLHSAGILGRNAHATSIAIMLPLSLLSGSIYLFKGQVNLMEALKFIPLGLVGSLCGAYLLPKINTILLKRIFGIMLIFSAVRILIQ